jgi:MarR family 2-MHQ and catechol resistance regulon transcriptional repressor
MKRSGGERYPVKSASKNDEDLSGIHLWLVLAKASHAIEMHARKSIAETGLGISDFMVLEALLHKGPLLLNKVGEKVLLTAGSITAAIDRLERMNLVERGTDPDDRRARPVRLTPTGRTLIRRVFPQHSKAMERAAAALTESERALLIKLLRTWGTAVAENL